MASREEVRRPRLYLVTEPVDDAAALARQLAPTLAAADVAAVLLRLPAGGERDLIELVKSVAPVVQRAGAALLLDGRPDLAARTGADGAHLTGVAAFGAAVKDLKPERIAGAGGLATRHDAMLAAEAGADYVMFGEPKRDRQVPALAAVVERLGWWSEVFEIPCVGYACRAPDIAALVGAGADFIALGGFVWEDARGPATAVASAAERLRSAELV